MKILFVGSTRRTALALNYFTNMVKLGHIVLPFEPDYFKPKNFIDHAIIRLRKEPNPARVRAVNQELVSLCRRNQFDMVFVMAENFLCADSIEEMKRVSNHPHVIVFHSHDNVFADTILKPKDFNKALAAYDLVFTTKSQNVKRYAELGQMDAHFLPSAFEPSIHHPIEDRYSRYAGKLFDVTFIGTYDHSRIDYLREAGWDRLNVWGDQWKKFPEFKKHRSHIHPRAIYDFEFADVTSHSKISLGLLREEACDLHTTRTFEIPACGTMQIAPRNDEVLQFFEENTEIVCFSSTDELKDKVDYYLRHEYQRSQIARRGHERCLRDKNTYLDRVKEILEPVKRHAKMFVPDVTAAAMPLR